jgi:cation diffusion facilitator family transporter
MAAAPLRSIILLSVLAALVTIAMKTTAYLLTGSVGLLSDALESGVNLVAAVTAYWSLHYASRPVDATHTYGHEKIEYFSAGLEGTLILVAGVGTMAVAVRRMIFPTPLEELGTGTLIALAASLINLVVGVILVRQGRKHHSLILEADGKHLLTDVWTSVGVVGGLGIVWLTKLDILDALLALFVGMNILWTGFQLIRRSFNGLMDHAIPTTEQETLRQTLRQHLPPGMTFHALRTRQAGARRFVDFHLLVPGHMNVRDAHRLGTEVEEALRAALPHVEITIHIEPIEEPASFEDNTLRGIEPGT